MDDYFFGLVLEDIEDGAAIYVMAAPIWTERSESEFQELIDEADFPPVLDDGKQYLLEVFIAKEILEDWSAAFPSSKLSVQEKCRLLVYYAENDAYPTGATLSESLSSINGESNS